MNRQISVSCKQKYFLTGNPCNKPMGFTLIELMIVVLIIAVIGFIALPSYRDYVLRSSRAEGKAALMTIASKQEQYYLDNKTYTATIADLNVPTTTESGKYTMVIIAADATSYSLEAQPAGGQVDDTDCADLTLDSNGTKGASGPLGADCW